MLINRLLSRLGYEKKAPVAQAAPTPKKEHDPIIPIDVTDLDIEAAVRKRMGIDTPEFDMSSYFKPVAKVVSDDPFVAELQFADDASIMKAGDNCYGNAPVGSHNLLSPALLEWYARSGSFIGYQAMAVLSQHWLIDKACSQPGEDAVRHGYDINLPHYDGDSSEISEKLKAADRDFKLVENLTEANRFCNIFGVRLCLFLVDSDDPDYYEKPFNIDGVKRGCYKGISQIDAQWTAPVLSDSASRDPANSNFYDPTWWIIQGRRFHKSHFVILRGAQPPDVLKPSYLYGGISMTQRIYEHVYAAERTSAEAPRLAMAKRTTSMKLDLAKGLMNERSLMEKLSRWVRYRDNFSVKILGKDEELQESDTSLADLDAVIMNQYQIVSGICKIPSMKLLGTSPKGFSTGGDELVNYHEELESIQSNRFTPILMRHYLLQTKSIFGEAIDVDVAWKPVASLTAEQIANINKTKVDTDQVLVNIGSVSPDEVRDRVRTDPMSGFNIPDDEPETLEELLSGNAPGTTAQTAEQAAAQTQAKAQQGQAVARQEAAKAQQGQALAAQEKVGVEEGDEAPITSPMDHPLVEQVISAICEVVIDASNYISESEVPTSGDYRTARPSVRGIKPTAEGVVKDIGWIHKELEAHGLTFVIENEAGSYRSGYDMNGNRFRSKMPVDYGFIKGIEAEDGDELDVFIGPNLENGQVYCITQNNPQTGAFDEYKIMFGFDTPEEAESCYRAAFSPDWNGFGKIERVTK